MNPALGACLQRTGLTRIPVPPAPDASAYFHTPLLEWELAETAHCLRALLRASSGNPRRIHLILDRCLYGLYGPRLRAAVGTFQAHSGLEATGLPDTAVLLFIDTLAAAQASAGPATQDRHGDS